MADDHEATIELDLSGDEPRIWLTLPRQSFALAALRQFAAYLTLVADENEPSPDVDALARDLEDAALIGPSHRATARALIAAGYRRGEAAT